VWAHGIQQLLAIHIGIIVYGYEIFLHIVYISMYMYIHI
jgi:hypothetical protein